MSKEFVNNIKFATNYSMFGLLTAFPTGALAMKTLLTRRPIYAVSTLISAGLTYMSLKESEKCYERAIMNLENKK